MGVCRYAEEPAVLAWELANEPHTGPVLERGYELRPGAMVTAWLDEMSRHLRGPGRAAADCLRRGRVQVRFSVRSDPLGFSVNSG